MNPPCFKAQLTLVLPLGRCPPEAAGGGLHPRAKPLWRKDVVCHNLLLKSKLIFYPVRRVWTGRCFDCA